jgi:hypothetical protein
MYEKKDHPLAPIEVYWKRVIFNLTAGICIIIVSLGLGMLGYSHFEHMSLIDAFENAAMILAGMGPVDIIKTEGGKIFAGCYTLFSGVIFLIVIALVIAPIFHRFFHRFLLKDTK